MKIVSDWSGVISISCQLAEALPIKNRHVWRIYLRDSEPPTPPLLDPTPLLIQQQLESKGNVMELQISRYENLKNAIVYTSRS